MVNFDHKVSEVRERSREESQRSAAAAKPADVNTLITGAAKDLADYQRLTAEGKLGESGQKLEQLKQKLDELNANRR